MLSRLPNKATMSNTGNGEDTTKKVSTNQQLTVTLANEPDSSTSDASKGEGNNRRRPS